MIMWTALGATFPMYFVAFWSLPPYLRRLSVGKKERITYERKRSFLAY
jgi:hypothetical protein